MSSSLSDAVPSRNPWQWLVGSDSRRLAIETGAAILLTAEALFLLCFPSLVPTWLQALLWLQWALTGVLLRVGGLFKIFGPVMMYDLLRASRRKRYLLLRVFYVIALLLLACWVYALWMIGSRDWRLSQQELSMYALSFFSIFAGVQFLAVVILTPAYVAGAISEEKERKTLEFLLATDLRDTEIVLGKLVSRLGNLMLLLIAGLPVLSAFQYLGGVDPNLVVAAFAGTVLTATSLGAIGIYFSVTLKKSRDAIALTYIVFAVYVLVTVALHVLRYSWFGALVVPGTDTWLEPITGTTLLQWIGAGNPGLAIFWIFETAGRARTLNLELTLPWVLRNYAIFHGLISIGLPLWATLRLRRVTLDEPIVVAKKKGQFRAWPPKPGVGRWPVIWREIFIERGVRFHWIAKLLVAGLVVLSFLPVVFIFWYNVVDPPSYYPSYRFDTWKNFARAMNVWVRFMGPTVACLTLLGVAVRAAGAITGEKAKNTWDEILTTPLSSHQILFGKFLGAILGVRWGFAWLLAIWIVAAATGGMVPLALPVLVLAWLAYASLLAVMGLWFSMTTRTTLISTVVTLFCTLLVSVGHWLVTTLLVYMPAMILRVGFYNNRGLEELAKWFVSMQIGMTPPVVFGILAVRWEDLNIYEYHVRDTILRFVTCSVLGAALWGLLATLFYLVADWRFRQLTNRTPFPRRDAPPSTKPAPTG